MSLKFNYNTVNFIFLPVTRTASTAIESALLSSHTKDEDYDIELCLREETYTDTWRHITYNEVTNMNSYDGTEIFFSVVRHPMDRCISLYNYIRSLGWVSDTNFNTYWTDVITNKNHSPNVSFAARTSTLQKDIVMVDSPGKIYKFETDLSQLESDFGITLELENESENIVVDDDIEAVRSLIESHFDEDYTTFGYSKS